MYIIYRSHSNFLIDNAGIKCAVLRQISLERATYFNSEFHPFLRPKLTPGLPYRMKNHETFEDDLHRSLLQEMAEAGCDLNDEFEYDKRRLQRMNAYRLKYWSHDVAVNYEDINADIMAKIEDMEARENGGKRFDAAIKY